MSERVTMATGPDGDPVARKEAHDPADAATLAHEAALLRRADHPGVVRLVGEAEDHLTLAWVGPHTLATRPPRRLPPAAGVLVSLITTVADLHQAGITHGAIEADHVLLDGRGRPVLCSLRAGAIASSPTDADHRARVAADVADLGRLVEAMLAGVDPGRRWDHRRQVRAGRRLARRIVAAPPEARPSARALATALAESVPCARLPNDRPPVAPPTQPGHALAFLEHLRPPDDPPPAGAARGRRALVLGLGAAVVVALGLLTAARGEPGSPAPTTAPAAQVASPGRAGGPAPAPEVAAPTPAPTAATTDPPASCPVVAPADTTASLLHDTDGDGCPEPVRVEGTAVEAGGRRWVVGQGDDVVTVGDWDCDGVATPALLRPATGEVFVFPAWAPPAGRLEAAPVTTRPGAVALTAGPGPCGRLATADAEGHLEPVPLPAVAGPGDP